MTKSWLKKAVVIVISIFAFSVHAAEVGAKPKRWGPLTGIDYWALGTLTAGVVAANFSRNYGIGSWNGEILFDHGVRNSLRASNPEARVRAATVSNYTVAATALSPFIVDAAILQWWKGNDFDGAIRTSVIAAQSVMASALIYELVKRSIPRRRPYQAAYEAGESHDSGVNSGGDENRSFFSGHTTLAYTGAGLICRNHKSLDLTGGNERTDRILCFSALGVATLTGVLRMASDHHYFSDVFLGAAVGFVSGYFLPSVFHQPEEGENLTSWMVVPGQSGSLALVKTLRF